MTTDKLIAALRRHTAWWTHDADAAIEVGHLYYFAPADRSPGPYKTQRHVTAIIDIAADGTLAGVELIDDMPPPPAADRLASTQVEGLELETTAESRLGVFAECSLADAILRDFDRLRALAAAERDRAERMEGALREIADTRPTSCVSWEIARTALAQDKEKSSG